MLRTLFDWIATGDGTVAWMLTYLLHSTLLLALATAANRLLPRAQLAARETLWKTALLGGLLTATLQTGLAIEPLAGAWRVAPTPGAPAAIAGLAGRATAPASRPATAPPSLAPEPASLPMARVEAPAETAPAIAPPSPRLEATATGAAGSWRAWIASFWLLGAALLLALLGLSHFRFRHRLTGRRDLGQGHLRQLLDGLLTTLPRRQAVRLTASGRITVPLARGIRRREICFPERALTELAPERQEVILAHELAHLERRDPLWLLVTRVVERLFFFQPLNRLARRRLQEIAEYRCDDWAVERTGRPVSMARCLTEVAEWGLAGGVGLPAPAMAVDRSRLGRRVRRLLDRGYPAPGAERPRWLRPVLLAVLAVTVLAAPAVIGARPTERDAGDELRAPRTAARSVEAPTAQRPATPAAPITAARPPLAPLASRAAPAPAASDAPSPAPRPAIAPLAPKATAPALAPALAAVPAVAPAPAAEIARLEAEIERAASEVAWTQAEIAAASEEIARRQASELRGIEPQMEAGIEALSVRLNEVAQPDPEALARLEQMARRMAERHRPDPEAMARLWALAEHMQPDPEALARLEQMAARIADTARPDPEALARLEQMARRMAERAELGAKVRAQLREQARRIAEQTRLTEEERAQLREEARRIAEQARLTAEERAALREEVRRIALEARPSQEEMKRLREELRAAREELREQRRRHVEELERQRQRRPEERTGEPRDDG